MFTWTFKMAAIFCKMIYVSTDPQMYRYFESITNLPIFDFLKIFVILGGGGCAPIKKSNGGIFLPPFQIEVGGTKEHPAPLG